MKPKLILIVLVALVSGYAIGRKPCRNYQVGVQTKVYIKLSECSDLPAGQYTCDHVRFDPMTVDARARALR